MSRQRIIAALLTFVFILAPAGAVFAQEDRDSPMLRIQALISAALEHVIRFAGMGPDFPPGGDPAPPQEEPPSSPAPPPVGASGSSSADASAHAGACSGPCVPS